MTPRVKTILVVLIAITLVGVGYFFIINKPASPISPPVNTAPPQTEEIDTADWKTFKSDKLRFEVKYPGAWEVEESLSPDYNQGFVGKIIGYAYVHILDDNFQIGAEIFPSFRLSLEDVGTNKITLEDFTKKIPDGIGELIEFNGLPATRNILREVRGEMEYYWYSLVLKDNGNKFYRIIFEAYSDHIDQDIAIWNKILSTLKIYPQ